MFCFAVCGFAAHRKTKEIRGSGESAPTPPPKQKHLAEFGIKARKLAQAVLKSRAA
jgi:hypothetical protein